MSDLIEFTAPQLQPCLTVTFILAYAQQVLVEKFDVLRFLRITLPTATAICCHTDIVHIHPLPKGEHRGTRYVWVHTNIRPWGHQLPVQCPKCWCIRPWVSTSQPLGEFFACEHCNHRLPTFSPPEQEHNQFGGPVSRGRWLTFEHLS